MTRKNKPSKSGSPFLRSLRKYLRRDKHTSEEKQEKNADQKTVKVSKKQGLALLANSYKTLSHTDRSRVRHKKSSHAAAKNKKHKLTHKKKHHAFSESEDLLPDDLLDNVIPEIEDDTSADEYIEIPESLMAEAKELEVLSQSISKEEIEEAAKFLGVFSGEVGLGSLSKSMRRGKKHSAHKATKTSEKSHSTKAAKKHRTKKKKKVSAGSGSTMNQLNTFLGQQKKLLNSLGSLSALSALNPKRLTSLVKAAPKLARLAKKADKIEKIAAQQPVQSATPDAVVPQQSTGLEGVSEEEVEKIEKVEKEEQAENEKDKKDETVNEKKPVVIQEEVIPGDPTAISGETMVNSGAAGLEEAEDSDDDLVPELNADEATERQIELAEEAQHVEQREEVEAAQAEKQEKRMSRDERRQLRKEKRRRMKERAEWKRLQRRKKRRGESVEDIKKEGLGIDMQAMVQSEETDPKKAKRAEKRLREELEEEDFLETTDEEPKAASVGSVAEIEMEMEEDADDTTMHAVAPEPSESRRERKLRKRKEAQRNKNKNKKELAEEKLWKDEAKRREKVLKEREEKRKKREETMKSGKKMKIKIPKKRKKQSKIKTFLNSLNYMGMGKDRVAFINNLGTMMDAGLPLLDALRSLEMESKNKQMKKILNKVITAIEMGSSLWRAMDAQYFFTPQQVAMVKVGEEAGNLVQNLKYLSIQIEKDTALKGKIKTAMIYPVIVFTMLTVIIMGLGIFVLPNLIQVIYGLGVPLPFITRMIVKFTNIFQEYGATIVPGFFGGMIVFGLLTKYTSFKIPVQWAMFKIPGIGALMKEATLSRFGVVMGGLLQAGLPVTEAIESIAEVSSVVRYKKFYYQLLENIKLGDSFTTSFRKIKLADKCFPTSVQQLVITGEKSGALTKVLLKIGEIHDKKATEVAEKLPVILEPMLLLTIGTLVGTIALGILAPIYSIVGNLG